MMFCETKRRFRLRLVELSTVSIGAYCEEKNLLIFSKKPKKFRDSNCNTF